jgi:hypothetical protein
MALPEASPAQVLRAYSTDLLLDLHCFSFSIISLIYCRLQVGVEVVNQALSHLQCTTQARRPSAAAANTCALAGTYQGRTVRRWNCVLLRTSLALQYMAARHNMD